MSVLNTINGTYTLDESSGIQTGADGTPASPAPRPDSDINLTGASPSLQADASAFYTYLFTTLGLDPTFSAGVGAAESSTSIINVTDASGGTIGSIGLTDADGNSFPENPADPADRVSSGLQTADGDHTIYLVSDSLGGVDNQIVFGKYDSDGDGSLDSYAFAVGMKPDGALDSNVNVQLFSVTFTALEHIVDGSTAAAYDDAVDLLQNVYVHSTGELNIKFDAMPSGANLFNDAGESKDGGGIIVFGENPVVGSDGKYSSAGDYISTSQGGTGATIGVNSQMFDQGEAAYFTFVNDIADTYFSGLKKGGLSSTEADYQQNMQYANLINSNGASLTITQTQGNNDGGMHIEAYELSQAWKGADLITNRGEGGPVEIDHVVVYSSTGAVLEDSDSPNLANSIEITLNNDGTADVTGLDDGMKIEWHTVSDHNQVLIRSTAGDFDVGGFGIKEGSSDTDSLAGHAWVEDDGPSIGNIVNSIVDFAAGSSTGPISLVGAVGTDAVSSPYSLTDWTGNTGDPAIVINGVTLTAVPNATGTDPVTAVGYWADTNGTAGIQTTGLNPDTEYYQLTLGETGAGSYTFDVLVNPPINETHFGFGAQPSGQNLFGIIPTNANNVVNGELPDGGLLFFNSGVKLDADGKYISSNKDPSQNSSTVNTSKGGGDVSIGYGANNYTADGQDANFIFVDNPKTSAASGIGLTATTADDADTVRFSGLNPANSASVEIVKIVSSNEAGVTIKAWDLNAAQATINSDSLAENLLKDPLTSLSATASDINGLVVIRETAAGDQIVYSAADKNADGDFTDAGEFSGTGNVQVTENNDGSVTVLGLDTNADYTIKYTTVAPHDMAQVMYEAGSYNIGGFNVFQNLDTIDQKFDFTAQVKDSDGDTATDSWSVGIDGTGLNHDGHVLGVL